MTQQVTFVTVGKLKDKTVAIGPGQKYQFVNGEMKVDEELASLVARALQFYSAFPKGDAEQYHLAACSKLKIDPVTLGPLSEKKVEKVAPEPDPDPEPEPEVSKELPKRLVKLRRVLENLDKEDESNWTNSGKPSLVAVKRDFDGDVSRSEVDAVWDVILNDT